jgi:hypothetical protein
MHFSTYREFYPKALIIMGEKDRNAINDPESRLTHWLVSLEGILGTGKEYSWEVAVYPADSEGTFNWKTPLYRSSLHESFDDAYEEAILLVKNCQNQEMSMINFIE